MDIPSTDQYSEYKQQQVAPKTPRQPSFQQNLQFPLIELNEKKDGGGREEEIQQAQSDDVTMIGNNPSHMIIPAMVYFW
jgi:hypothetical protein